MVRLLHLIIFSFIAFYSFSQPWRSRLYPTNWTPSDTNDFYVDAFLQDYSYAGYKYGEVPLPTPNGQVFDVTKPPYNADKTGVNDATIAIQTAINAAQINGGGVVYLPAGMYKVNPGTNNFCLRITKEDIILKGDGVGRTFILNSSFQMADKSIISVSGSSAWNATPSSIARLRTDVMNPTTTLPIDNPALFAVGDMVMVRNFINDDWINEHNENEWLGEGANLRGIMYCRYIKAVDRTMRTITLDVPLRYALKVRDNAMVFKLNGMISEVGLSDFSIGNVQHPGVTGYGEEDHRIAGTAAFDCEGSFVIRYNSVVNAWIKNVSTYRPSTNSTGTHMLSNGILINNSKNVTIENCSMSYAQYGGGGGNGYAYRISANETLITNSTSSHVRHGYVFSSMWCSGNVIHKCKDINTGFQTGNTGNMRTNGIDSDHHQHFSQSNLIDSSYCENSAFVAFYRNFGSVPKHNLTSTHTTFWNIIATGSRSYSVWTQQSRYGYAIGTSGTTTTIRTNENGTGSGLKTLPIDISEGQGRGTTLVPQSLYKDQLTRRLNQLVLDLNVNEVKTFDEEPKNYSPNPFHTAILISHDGPYSIYNFSGTKVTQGNCLGNCDVGADLQPGSYILELGFPDRLKQIKLLKQ